MKNRIIAIILSGCLYGCSVTGTSQPSHFYMLQVQELKQQVRTMPKKTHVVIRNVNVPSYLDRAQIVTKNTGTAEVTLGEFHRWAEPLTDSLPRMLSRNMRAYAKNLSVRPARSGRATGNYQLNVDIISMDSELDGMATLEASWMIADENGNKVTAEYRKFTESIDGTYDDYVKKQSAMVAKLSNDMIDDLIKYVR